MTQRKYAFTALIALCICMLALYIHRHRKGQTGVFDNMVISVSGGIQKQLFYFAWGMRTIFDHYIILINTKKENEELAQEVSYLKTKLTALKETELENERLRNALDFAKSEEQSLKVANVIAHDISSDYLGIRVDLGGSDGIKVGMGVISPHGLVGRVLRIASHYADVQTLLDPSSNIDAVIQRSRVRGIISGQSKKLTCIMKYIDKLEDIAVNDTVVSSGFGNIFPKGLLIGYVTAVIPDSSGILQGIIVKSAVDIYRLEEVFIVVSSSEPKETS